MNNSNTQNTFAGDNAREASVFADGPAAQTTSTKKKKSGPLFYIALLLCLAVLSYSGYELFKIFYGYHEADTSYEKTTQEYVEAPSPGSGDFYPVVDWAKLLADNPNVVGWVFVEGTKINYPVVQAQDNLYYLTHLYDGTKNVSGAIFMDAENTPGGLVDDITVLHGHHMKNGSMFAHIENYKSQEFFEGHPFGYYLTPNRAYRIEFFSGNVRTPEPLPLIFGTAEERAEYINDITQRSNFNSKVEVGLEDKMMAFSTCDYSINDGRYILTGRLVPLD